MKGRSCWSAKSPSSATTASRARRSCEEIPLKRGQAYSDDKRLESQRRLSNLGSFRSIRIVPEPRLPGEQTVRLTISLEELPEDHDWRRRRRRGGSGARGNPRMAASKTRSSIDPRAFFEMGRRNLGGRNRDLNFFSRVSLKPSTARSGPGDDTATYGFTEYRVSGTYRERYAFRSNIDLLFGATSEQAVRPTFSYLRRLLNADLLHSATPRVTVSGRYVLEFNRLFDRLPDESQSFPLDRYFPELRLSIFSGGVLWNRRDDPLAPTEGFQLGATSEMALEELGSQAGFVKGFVQGSYFRPLRRTTERSLVLATRAQLGAARGFARVRTRLDEDGNEIIESVQDVPASQRFFAGGSSTVRGFQLDRLGVPEILTVDGISNGGNAQVDLQRRIAGDRRQALQPQSHGRRVRRQRAGLPRGERPRSRPAARHWRVRLTLRLSARSRPPRLRLQDESDRLRQRTARAGLGVPPQHRRGLLEGPQGLRAQEGTRHKAKAAGNRPQADARRKTGRAV